MANLRLIISGAILFAVVVIFGIAFITGRDITGLVPVYSVLISQLLSFVITASGQAHIAEKLNGHLSEHTNPSDTTPAP